MTPQTKVVIAALIFGSSGAFVKFLNLPVMTISFIRMAVPTLLLFLFFLIKKEKIFPFHSKLLLLGSFLNALRMVFYFTGYTYTSIGTAVILLYTWPVFAVLYSFLFLKEKITPRVIILVLTAFSGVILIYSEKASTISSSELIGIISIIFSAMVYAGTIIIFKYKSDNISNWHIVFFQNLAGAFIFLPFLFVANDLPDMLQTGVAVTYAVLIGLIGFGLLFSALKQIPASKVSLLNYMEVISAVVLGVYFFEESVTAGTVTGGGLILLSAFLINRK